MGYTDLPPADETTGLVARTARRPRRRSPSLRNKSKFGFRRSRFFPRNFLQVWAVRPARVQPVTERPENKARFTVIFSALIRIALAGFRVSRLIPPFHRFLPMRAYGSASTARACTQPRAHHGARAHHGGHTTGDVATPARKRTTAPLRQLSAMARHGALNANGAPIYGAPLFGLLVVPSLAQRCARSLTLRVKDRARP